MCHTKWQWYSALSFMWIYSRYFRYSTHQQLTKSNTIESHWLKVPQEALRKSVRLMKLHLINAFIWVPMNQIVDVTFISQTKVVQNLFV